MERTKRPEGYNLKDDAGTLRDPSSINTLRVPVFKVRMGPSSNSWLKNHCP